MREVYRVSGQRFSVYDLSQNGSLHSLEISANLLGMGSPGDHFPLCLRQALEAIQSQELLNVTVYYKRCHFLCMTSWKPGKDFVCELSKGERQKNGFEHSHQLRVLREAQRIQCFSLTLRVCVPRPLREHGVEMLREAIAAEKEREGSDAFLCEPLVEYWTLPSKHVTDPW